MWQYHHSLVDVRVCFRYYSNNNINMRLVPQNYDFNDT